LRSVGAAARSNEVELKVTHWINEATGFPPVEEFVDELVKHREAIQEIIDTEGLTGLQARIRESAAFRSELIALREQINGSLGSAGPSRAWSHYPDLVIGGDPFAIGGSVDARVNSIIGPASRQWAEQFLQLDPNNHVPNISLKIDLRR